MVARFTNAPGVMTCTLPYRRWSKWPLAVLTVTRQSAFTARAHSKNRLSGSCWMTASVVRGKHTCRHRDISARKFGSLVNTSAYSSSMAGDAQSSTSPCSPSSTISADGLSAAVNVASFRMQVSSTSFKGRAAPCATDVDDVSARQRPRLALPSWSCHGASVGRVPAPAKGGTAPLCHVLLLSLS